MELTALSNYQILLQKVDAKFTQIHRKYPQEFQCQKGCFACCKRDLSVSQIEAQNIRRHLKNPGVLESLALDKGMSGHCEFLSEQGACLIYEARPIICRSHGAPIRWQEDQSTQNVDVCYLNFTTQDLEQLSDEDFFQVETLNTILAVLNQQAGYTSERIPLTRFHFADKHAL